MKAAFELNNAFAGNAAQEVRRCAFERFFVLEHIIPLCAIGVEQVTFFKLASKTNHHGILFAAE